MPRTGLLLVFVVAAVIAILSFAGTFLPHQTMMYGKQRMMGASSVGDMFWPSVLTASSIFLVAVIAYLFAFPAIRYSQPNDAIVSSVQKVELTGKAAQNADAIDLVMRVLKPDERAALEVLRNSGGVCLQKDITYKAGLSKLKTHRVVARLAERGVIQVRRVGKTNEITVPAWLKKPPSTEPKS